MAMKWDSSRASYKEGRPFGIGGKDRLQPISGTIGISLKDLGQLEANIEGLGRVIRKKVAEILAQIAIDVLARAVPRTPVDTGLLRESGRAYLEYGHSGSPIGRVKYKDVGWGRKDGSIEADPSRIDIQDTTKSVGVGVEFSREGEAIFAGGTGILDVAVWAHEDLNPHGGAKPAARTPGTGPKYLEGPYLEKKNEYTSILERELSTKGIIKSIQGLVKLKPRTGKYMVDEVKLEYYKYLEEVYVGTGY